jgi:enediyne biosynthesis protein E4
VTEKAGLPGDIYGLGLAVADLNGDGRPDFFVGHSNRLFLSAPENLYVEPADLKKFFAWEAMNNEDWPCGAAIGDLNRDGLPDLVLSVHHVKARNRIFLSEGIKDGVPRFRDVTAQAGLPEFVPEKSPHVEIRDFDNDGWPDLYFSTAWMDTDGSVTPLVYRNQGAIGGSPRFEPIRNLQKDDKLVYFPAGPSADVDGDGLTDLFLVNWHRGNHCRLFRNTSGGGNRWLDIEIEGSSFNRQGLGTKVRISAGGKLLGLQEIGTGWGYASGQIPRCHFGLGDASKVDIEVRFPNGTARKFENVEELNRTMKIKE